MSKVSVCQLYMYMCSAVSRHNLFTNLINLNTKIIKVTGCKPTCVNIGRNWNYCKLTSFIRHECGLFMTNNN